MTNRDRELLVEEIARSRARVADLEHQRDAELMRIAEIESEIAALDAPPASPPSDVAADPGAPTEPAGLSSRRTPEQKLRIFRGFFRGREDVYPTLSTRNDRFQRLRVVRAEGLEPSTSGLRVRTGMGSMVAQGADSTGLCRAPARRESRVCRRCARPTSTSRPTDRCRDLPHFCFAAATW